MNGKDYGNEVMRKIPNIKFQNTNNILHLVNLSALEPSPAP